MNKRIFIEYKVNNVLDSAYSVVLGSQDGLYGVKTQSGEVIVSDSTAVTNSSTGVYEYDLEVEEGIIYLASWKIVSSVGSQPVYATQSLGPFYLVSQNTIKTVADQRGTFIQSTSGTLFLNLTDIHGNPLAADTITITITKDGTEIVSTTPDFINTGFYAFDWSVASDAEIGSYTVTWEYEVNGFVGTEIQSINISASSASTATIQLYDIRINDLRVALSQMIGCAQKIPIFHEQAVPDPTNQKFKFTFNKWNQAFGTRIYRNNKQIEDGIEINYFRGFVTFDQPISDYDTINADYNFRWFSDEELDRFLENAIFINNMYPPATPQYNLANFPDNIIPIILYGAAKDAIREMLMCLNFQQPQQVFGGMEAAQKAFSNMETLKKNYEEEVTRLLEQKKFGKYPKIRSVVTPEFTLPGGRSRWFRYMFGGGTN